MSPPQMHWHVAVSFSAGGVAVGTVTEPVVQGNGVTGTQGIGVSTPIALDVAEATEGFARLEHMAKGRMFTIGT